ncbi:hypothetical protein K7432_009418 [Basidiobolus ranarum]|uniref:alpha-1,2-Mannosidase n=1 Tax=Basidiobolus ranarum TaxID=34480 RepID=A0ABR2VX38_9FUNG
MKYGQCVPSSRMLITVLSIFFTLFHIVWSKDITEKRRIELRDKAKEMFYHGFNNYMTHGFPLDELNPLNCSGRGRDKKDPNNIHVNDVLGEYTLTLIDSLDTLALLGDQKGFEEAVNLVIQTVDFDLDSKVQLFEVNIRVLGGLLSAHQLAIDEKLGYKIQGYKGELLDMAYDLGIRLLPAFGHSRTRIPYPRVNLRYGLPKGETSETCTAGAGSLMLEFGVLSKLTNDSRFDEVARTAIHGLWNRRSKSNLIGNVIDVESGKWIHPIASTGAGVDSFYEYMLKSYVLFGDAEFIQIYQQAYKAIMEQVVDKSGYFYLNVNMYSGELAATWIDSLSAYFAGVQVLAGDLENAIKSHLVFYNLWRKYHAIPERFDLNSKKPVVVHYPLRPEFVESTYLLYQATKDPFYLTVGEMVLNDLEKYTRVECGFASVKSVITMTLEDRMESFVLSETLKYLYLLFDTDHQINSLDSNFVFTTEGHPLFLSSEHVSPPRSSLKNFDSSLYTCPNLPKLPLISSTYFRPDTEFVRSIIGHIPKEWPTLDEMGWCLDPRLTKDKIDISRQRSEIKARQPTKGIIDLDEPRIGKLWKWVFSR